MSKIPLKTKSQSAETSVSLIPNKSYELADLARVLAQTTSSPIMITYIWCDDWPTMASYIKITSKECIYKELVELSQEKNNKPQYSEEELEFNFNGGKTIINIYNIDVSELNQFVKENPQFEEFGSS